MDPKLAVIFRTYSGETDGKINPMRPDWFNKYKIFKSVADEFVNKDNVLFYVIWDGNDENTSQYCQYIKSFPITQFFNYGKLGNKGVVEKSFDLALTLNDVNYLYFLEDDQAHWAGARKVLFDLFKYNNLVCLYDNLDRYTNIGMTDVTLGHESIGVGDYCHIRTCESTIMSFACTSELFDDYEEVFYRHNREGVGAPNDRSMFREFIQKGIRLISPMPSYSTHVVKNGLAPLRNWESFFNSIVL